jgi:hypothetical protein
VRLSVWAAVLENARAAMASSTEQAGGAVFCCHSKALLRALRPSFLAKSGSAHPAANAIPASTSMTK